MSDKEAIEKLELLIGIFEDYNKSLLGMEEKMRKKLETPLAA